MIREVVLEVAATWERPPAGADVTAAPGFAAAWSAAAELGWTSILDGSAEPELVEAACEAVEALGEAGVALPLRQVLVARHRASAEVPPAAIAVHSSAYGVWLPAAEVLVGADGSVTPAAHSGTADVDLAGRPCGPAEGDRDPLAELLALHELLGAATGALAEVRRYTRERVQFGRPLGALPAVRSALGELTVAHRELETAVRQARLRFPAFVPYAAAVARPAALEIARQAHQLHGAMGITAEAGLYRRTTLLWAGCDEFAGPAPAAAVSAEGELWELTAPAAG